MQHYLHRMEEVGVDQALPTQKGEGICPPPLHMLSDGDVGYGSTGIARHCTPLAVTSASRLSYWSRTERGAHVFDFEFENGQWRFTGEIAALTSVTSPDWLSGDCAECYYHWERWEGAAP